jgi:hypothetical protein
MAIQARYPYDGRLFQAQPNQTIYKPDPVLRQDVRGCGLDPCPGDKRGDRSEGAQHGRSGCKFTEVASAGGAKKEWVGVARS